MSTAFIIPVDHPCLSGHFPGQPIVPGVLLLRRVISTVEATHGPLPAARLPQVKFVRPLLPDQPARIELESLSGDAPRWRFRVLLDTTTDATAEVGPVLIASGEIVA